MGKSKSESVMGLKAQSANRERTRTGRRSSYDAATPPWFGSLRQYARGKKHDMDSIRRSMEAAHRYGIRLYAFGLVQLRIVPVLCRSVLAAFALLCG